MPLVHIGQERRNFANPFIEVCVVPVAQRPRRVQELLDEMVGISIQGGTNTTRATEISLLRRQLKAFGMAPACRRAPSGRPTPLAVVNAFIGAMQAADGDLTAYLKRPTYDGPALTQRATVTLRSLRAQPGF